MTDVQHSEEKEALEDAIGRTAIYRGIALCTPSITRVGGWVTHDDGSVTGPNYTVTCVPSKAVKALIDASLDSVSPAPEPTPEPDPVPAPEPAPSPAPSTNRTPVTFAPADLHWRDTIADERVDVNIALDDGTTLAIENGDVGLTKMGDVLVLVRYADAVVIENPWPASTQNLAGILTVKVDGTVVFDGRARFDLRTGTRPIRTGLKQITPVDIRDQIGNLLPNYGDPGSFINLMPKDDGTRYGINGRGPMTYDAMGSTGGRSEIGLIPGGDLCYAIRGEQWGLARLGADHLRCYPIHMRDPGTGLPLDPALWPAASTLDAHLGYKYGAKGMNPVTAKSTSPLKPDSAHQPHYGVVPFLATGSDFDMEQLLFSASYQGTWNNAAYRQYENFIVSGQQTRGIAWGLASFAYAAKLLEGRHPQATSYRQALRNTAKYYWDDRFAPGKPQHNMFGVYPELAYLDGAGLARGVAPWQNHFLASALNLAVQYGYDEFKGWRDYSAAFPVNMMSGMCYQTVSIYKIFVVDPAKSTTRDEGQATPAQWYTSWAQIAADSVDPTQLALGCGAMSLGAPVGYVSDGRGPSTTFAANAQPAMAAAVDAGIEGASEMWAKFMQFRGPNGHIDYTDGAQFNILPLEKGKSA